MNGRSLTAAGAVFAALALAACAACASTTDGHGSGPTAAVRSSATSSHDFPSQSSGATSGTTSAAPPTSPESSGTATSPGGPTPLRTITVEGTTTGQKITGNIYATDDLTNCAAHAYGAPMIKFLRKYPCVHAHRVLSTIVVHGRTAVLSAIDASFRPIGDDPYAATGRFEQLERADNTGSINDLLRDGHTIPGIATHIPPHEVFQVVGQDNSATVFDAWWVRGTTRDDDAVLKRAETDVFLTPLS